MCSYVQELQLHIEYHRPEVVNVSRQVVDDADVTSRLQSVAERFERVCALADAWQSELQVALVHCPDFHQTIDNLHDWLSHIDIELIAAEPVDLTCQSELRKKYPQLKVLQQNSTQHVILCSLHLNCLLYIKSLMC